MAVSFNIPWDLYDVKYDKAYKIQISFNKI